MSDPGKRAFDVLAAAAGLVLLAPFLAVIAVAIRLSMGSPVLFRQLRPGLKGRPFMLHKFRTMHEVRSRDGRPHPGGARVSRLGGWLRRTSLDELPELWDVLRGKMSLVGPRPLLMEHLPLYSAAQAHRHDVRPGMTGWAQVNGRNRLSFHCKVALDLWYVAHRSPWLDGRILLVTIIRVLARRDIDEVQSYDGAEPCN